MGSAGRERGHERDLLEDRARAQPPQVAGCAASPRSSVDGELHDPGGPERVGRPRLNRPLEEISTLDKPEGSGAVEIDPIPETEELPVSYPKTIATHTAVILVELPSPKLHGAVFVKPRDA